MIRLFAFKWARVPVRITNEYWPGTWVEYDETVYGEIGVCIQPLGLWIGAHYSHHHQRLCINLIPCVTLWITLPGGKAP